MSKLQNVKAIKEMLAGTHKTQTRQTHYYGKTSTEIPEDDVYERDEDGNPKMWVETDAKGHRTLVTQHDGFKSRESESGYLIRKLQKELEMPSKCPNCGSDMHGPEKRLNEKFWNSHKTCFGCVLEMEQQIRNKGQEAWDKYAREKMYKNAKLFFVDADGDMEGLEKQLTERIENVRNADGDIEAYDPAMSKKKFKDTILKEYKKFKKETLSELKHGKKRRQNKK
jgi:hypothetical protein